ncbi:MAG: cupin domain-containing protein [Parvularcula sp.]|jgi:uncharacterized cupin superfamily protein|nr:cupin domain-containing protein [Parvularcula sp.]
MSSIQRLSALGSKPGGLDPIGLSFPDWVVSGNPQEAGEVYYDTPLASATVGIWHSDPGVVRFPSYPFDEVCMVVEGSVILRDADGGEERFGSGDVFIVPKGWAGDWIMQEPLRKFYVELKR